jgi:hypothetical protein
MQQEQDQYRMPFKAVYTDAAQIPTEHKAFYKETAGQGDQKFWLLDVEPVSGFNLENVEGLKGALSKERAARETAEKTAKAYTALGEPEKLTKAVEKLKKFESFDPESEAEKLAGAKAQAKIDALQAQWATERNGYEEKIKGSEGEITSLLVDAEVTRVLSEQDTRGATELLLPVFKSQVKVVRDEASGKRRAVVVDSAGNPRIKDALGNPVSIKDLAKELKGHSTYARAFDGTQASGSGAQQQNRDGRAGQDTSKLSAIQKIQAGLDSGGARA